MNSKFKKFLFPILLAALAFVVGMWWQRQIYIDTCLDMGGGWNPDGYPICVLEKIAAENPTQNPVSRKMKYGCGQNTNIEVAMLTDELVEVNVKRGGQPDLTFSAVLSPAGSGAKYVSGDGKLAFWEKDGECMVLEEEKVLFSGCK